MAETAVPDAGRSADRVETPSAAFDRWLARAETGEALAQFRIGTFYEEGRGRPQHFVLASSFYKKAAEQGHAEATYRVGRLYERGLGVPQKFDKAQAWYRQAWKLGHAPAATALGRMARDGLGGPRDLPEARRQFEAAAAAGDPQGDLALALLLANEAAGLDASVVFPERQPVLPPPAVERLRRAALAGLPEAAFRYAIASRGALGRQWLKRAADAGHAPAALDYAELLLDTEDPASVPLARGYLYLAASQDYAPAQHRLGVLHGRGEGIAVDHDAATYWFGRAALLGLPEAQEVLCLSLVRGRGIDEDIIAGAAWCRVAEQAGNAAAGRAYALITEGMSDAQRELIGVEVGRIRDALGERIGQRVGLWQAPEAQAGSLKGLPRSAP